MIIQDSQNPFFSIGVTTYNRIDLLKQSLLSLLEQEYSDFEIIIGNDYLPEPITKESLGIFDSRIIIINNKINLGELENMNSLLKAARGKYFTWQFDDDLSSPMFLSEIYYALGKSDYPVCVFTSFTYVYGASSFKFPSIKIEDYRQYSGRDFLRSYLSGSIRVLGLSGFYKTEYLISIGGATKLSDSKMALYSEYLLIVKAGLLDRVVYLNSELVANRVHDKSWSCRSSEVENFKQAGICLVRESIPFFLTIGIAGDFQKNLTSLLKSVISVVITKSRMADVKMGKKELSDFSSMIKSEFIQIGDKDHYNLALECLYSSLKQVTLFRLKAGIRSILPVSYLKFVHIVVHYISPFTNKSF
jgi:glycosyltransferase involved in cell wall biosynthesis